MHRRLLAARKIVRRVLYAAGALLPLMLLLRLLGLREWVITGEQIRVYLAVVGPIALVYGWLEVALAGSDPEDVATGWRRPGVPRFRPALIAGASLVALWQSLEFFGRLRGYSDTAWLEPKLAIMGVALGVAGAVGLLNAWYHRRTAHPHGRARALGVAALGLFALLLALPWEPFFPVTARSVKPWLYGTLVVGGLLAAGWGWWPRWDEMDEPEEAAGAGSR